VADIGCEPEARRRTYPDACSNSCPREEVTPNARRSSEDHHYSPHTFSISGRRRSRAPTTASACEPLQGPAYGPCNKLAPPCKIERQWQFHASLQPVARPVTRVLACRKELYTDPATHSLVIERGPSSMSHEWRNHPKLQGRLQAQYPDDVQVIVHDGGPRITDRRPEAVWVHIVASEAEVFTGEVLNQPEQLVSVKQGDRVQFLVPASGEHPLMVRPKYLSERDKWIIHPCDKCGLSELFDAPSDLIAKVFPNLPPGQAPEMFTAFCGVCGGVQGVELAGSGEDEMQWSALQENGGSSGSNGSPAAV